MTGDERRIHAGGRVRLLLAEDNEDDRVLFAEAVSSLDFPCLVDWVEDGNGVIEYLERRGSWEHLVAPPDAIILDLKMPRRGGFQTLAELKQRDEFREIPVIILTGDPDEESIEDGFVLGAHAYLTKPFRAKDFGDVLSHLFHEIHRIRQMASAPEGSVGSDG